MELRARIGALALVAVVGAAMFAAACGTDGANGLAGETTVGPVGEAGPPGEPGPGAEAGAHAPYNPGLDLKLSLDSVAINAQVATVTFKLTD